MVGLYAQCAVQVFRFKTKPTYDALATISSAFRVCRASIVKLRAAPSQGDSRSCVEKRIYFTAERVNCNLPMRVLGQIQVSAFNVPRGKQRDIGRVRGDRRVIIEPEWVCHLHIAARTSLCGTGSTAGTALGIAGAHDRKLAICVRNLWFGKGRRA